jgi:dTDP-4-amino-4,6-dideoxygalactose transaminase
MIEYENLKKSNEPFFADFQKAFSSVLQSGWFILGKNVAEFEKEFASYLNISHCLGVASGLDALFLSLKALDLPAGSEVIVPSNTYIATILSICQAGLIPVLAEPDLATYNISASEINRKITSKTKALMIVHLYGKSCDMDPILEICQRHHLKLIEDCAQSHGATYKGKKTGTFGEFGALAFIPLKIWGPSVTVAASRPITPNMRPK